MIELRIISAEATIGVTEILSLHHTAQCCGDNIGIGNVCAASVSLRLTGRHELTDALLTVELREAEADWAPLGTFAVTECTMGEETTTLTGYDAAFYGLSGDYVPTVGSGATVGQVVADIARQCSLMVDSNYFFDGSIPVSGDLTGHTCREMLGYMAMLAGCNAVISREGKLRLMWFQSSGPRLTAEDYYEDGLTVGGSAVLSGLRCEVLDAETGESAVLRAGSETEALTLTNPYMTQELLEALWLRVGGYGYTIGRCECFGGIDTRPGDMVQVTSRLGEVYRLPAMQVELTLDGGCRCTVEAFGRGAVASRGYRGPMLEKLVAVQNSVRIERSAREAAVANLASQMASAGGLYSTIETGESGSVYYLHDKPTLREAALVVKLNAAGIAISQNGGGSYPYGFNFVTGESIAETIHAGAAWIEQLFANDIEASGSIRYVFRKGQKDEAITSIDSRGIRIDVPGTGDGGVFSVSSLAGVTSDGDGKSILTCEVDRLNLLSPHMSIFDHSDDAAGHFQGELTVDSMRVGDLLGDGFVDDSQLAEGEEAVAVYGIQMSKGEVRAHAFVEDGTPLCEKYAPQMIVENVAVSITVAASSNASGSFSVAKSGCIPMGILGFHLTGSGTSYANIIQLYVENDKAYYYLRNSRTGEMSGTLRVSVLYQKT